MIKSIPALREGAAMTVRPGGVQPLEIAGVDKVVDSWADVVALFDVSHVCHMVKDKDFGMVGHHSLGEGELDRDAWVVLAIDEEDGHF